MLLGPPWHKVGDPSVCLYTIRVCIDPALMKLIQISYFVLPNWISFKISNQNEALSDINANDLVLHVELINEDKGQNPE